MAMGVPVVSSIEAAGGVDAVPGEHLLTASSAQDYVDAITRLLDSPTDRKRFAAAARERVLKNHNWQSSMERLDPMLEACANRTIGKTGTRAA